MKASDSPSQIGCSAFHTHLHSYAAHVPEKIHGLEEIRLREIPEALNQRKKDSDSFLEKTEVTALVEWKLKHGTYRPNLAKLVASNSVKDVREVTRSAFAIYESNNADYSKAVTALSKLKGIGPATASLLLSCYDPVKVPFFADELYRYLHWEEAKNKGWDRKIKYTMKEYKDLFDSLQILRERLEKESGEKVTAIEIEKMAYVLGKQAQERDFFDMDDDDRALQLRTPKRLKTPDLSEVPQALCLHKGPDGSPTYDKMGYELDYEYVKSHMDADSLMVDDARCYRLGRHVEEKAKIMSLPKRDPTKCPSNAMDDRVARDLSIPYHEVGLDGYKEWKKKGFSVEPDDLDTSKWPKKERDRISDLQSGWACRQGSKHRSEIVDRELGIPPSPSSPESASVDHLASSESESEKASRPPPAKRQKKATQGKLKKVIG